MKEEAESLERLDSNDKCSASDPVEPNPQSATGQETRKILKDNMESKKSIATVLESFGLSQESIARLLHLEDKG